MNEAFFVDKTMQTPFRSWRQSLGTLGEDAASLYLVGQGWRVIERNWRSYRACELDIVAKDPQGTVVFVEVKTRAAFIGVYGTESVESALASVDRSKQNKIKRGALIFLSKSGEPQRHGRRFDVLVVTIKQCSLAYEAGSRFIRVQERDLDLLHIEGAFD